MAELFFTMEPRMAPADSIDGFARVLATGQIPVWLPWRMCQDDKDIPADWTITSDGLAARLAERLGGLNLVLLKSVTAAPGSSAQDLAEEGVVDLAFPGIVERARLSWQVLGPDDDAVLARLIGAPHP